MSTSFVLPVAATRVIFCLNLNEALLLAAQKLTIAPLFKAGSSL